ncbi:MAG TPA: glycine zipper domain-containing protein, partial [Thermoanaerobaculia bacterium]|nr:glycine zipper domain-containing protein [Thermoanaerobaculia bacterium]
MDDERTRTAGLASGTSTAELDHEHTPGADANRDPLTGETGAHPVGTGVGAASGGTVGAVIGGAVGGPVGALIGAAVGGLAGGLAGKGVAESVNPTEEDAFWRDNYANRDYAQGRSYDDLKPAYQYGWESRTRHQDRDWNQAENELRSGWEQAKGQSRLAWDDAKSATRDAWDRVGNRSHSISSEDRAGSTTYGSTAASTGATSAMAGSNLGSATAGTGGHQNTGTTAWESGTGTTAGSHFDNNEDSYWRENFSSRPYAAGRNYDDYRPAYQYGYDAAKQYRGRRFEDVENELSSGWSRASSGSAGP